jgi:hypothetical protein
MTVLHIFLYAVVACIFDQSLQIVYLTHFQPLKLNWKHLKDEVHISCTKYSLELWPRGKKEHWKVPNGALIKMHLYSYEPAFCAGT